MITGIKKYWQRKGSNNAQRKKEVPTNATPRELPSITNTLLAAFTFLLFVVGVLQWCTFEKTDKTLRAGERAFVFIKQSPKSPWRVIDPLRKDVVRGYSIVLENSGNSQTVNLTAKLYCLRPNHFPIDDPIAFRGSPDVNGGRLLGPKQTIWAGECNYSADELNSVQTGEKHLYIGAIATYLDIFREPHITEYCVEILNIGGSIYDPKAPINNILSPCGRNCADEECNEKPH